MLALLCVVALFIPISVFAQPGKWWEVAPEPEIPSPYYDSILYSEIAPRLREIETASNRVRVEVIGQSAGGRNLFLATISAPEAMGRLGDYQAIRQTMLKDPEQAQEMIDRFGDFKVPFFINASIHGGEYPGVDAAVRLIETLAFSDTEEVNMILDNLIVLINVVQNPDGRVMGTRGNANGFDLNRDFITQSQPESRITARIFAEWNPMVVIDLHGFANPMIIEPCTPPHNPNYEYDLFIRWAWAQAEAMEDELNARTGFAANIPYRDWPMEWDDWAPTYVPMFAMFHGAYGHTLETPYRDIRGVDAHYWAVWGALKFSAQNAEAMVRDQIEIYKRGFLDLPQVPIPPELLPEWPQFQDVITTHFPEAYVIPADVPFQLSPQAAARLVDFLLDNGLEVEQASQAFVLDGIQYPAGTYIVWVDQPKRGLVNTLLSDGLDLSSIPGLEFYSPPTVWSLPRLWGVHVVAMEAPMAIATHPIQSADRPQGSVEGGKANAYAYLPTSIAAIQATNDLLARGVGVLRAPAPFTDHGRSFDAGVFILPASSPGAKSIANELAHQWGLDLLALGGVPAGAVPLRQLRIAAALDAAGRFQLRRFGFNFDLITVSILNSSDQALMDYDLFINSTIHRNTSGLNPTGRMAIQNYLSAGKDYIGIGGTGARLVSAEQYNLFPFTYTGYAGAVDAILRLEYDVTNPVAAGFNPLGYGFVNPPYTFSNLGSEVQTAISISDDDPNFLVSGYWPSWQASGASGKPIVIRWDAGAQDATLIGLNPIFRAHPEDSFRIVANAIYSGLE
mgnify:CR=1 FL=1